MLDPWIIEEILKRESETRKESENRVDLPLERPRYEEASPPKEESDRGVTVIDI